MQLPLQLTHDVHLHAQTCRCRSKYQLTYQQAQDISEGKAPTTGPRDMPVDPRDCAELQKRLQTLVALTDHLREIRNQVGLKHMPMFVTGISVAACSLYGSKVMAM